MRLFVRILFILLLIPLGGEALFRVGILFGWSALRNPDLYADWTSDEDYWKLRHLWVKRVVGETNDMWDPLLGWNNQKSATNPLGAHTDVPYLVDYQKPTLLFFGESFIQGTTSMANRIPQLTQKKLGIQAFNLGVKGYGWDQTLLKIQQVRFPFRHPVIVAGLLSVGLDRSILGFRTGLKPYFSAADQKLQIRGVPVRQDTDRWIEENLPQVTTYFGTFLIKKFRELHASSPIELSYRRAEKEEIGDLIIRQLVEESRALTQPLFFVLFFNRDEISYEGWREVFLKEEMRKRHVPFVDSKRALLLKAKELKVSVGSFYDISGVLNEKGNEIVAEALAELLKTDYLSTSSTPG